MKPYEYLNSRTSKLSMMDLKLSQGAAMCVALVIVKLFPAVLNIAIWWFLLAMVLLYVKPLYVFYFRK